ncbi:hypothetical protein AK812_SmicGene47721 [Symbiodinium microadriaticum]|uniref:Uncharacterized protein n=1 Tax=Symbiodinium microadriaticum TaxID=2951 RepID=A0A1Q9BR26_SYMMI|nr:hypothetical protein AK812_SmicGene47721 [Symbiodinium microadriaticum]
MGANGSVRRSKTAMSYLMNEFNRLKSHGVDGEAVWGEWFAASLASPNVNGASLPQAQTHVEVAVMLWSGRDWGTAQTEIKHIYDL